MCVKRERTVVYVEIAEVSKIRCEGKKTKHRILSTFVNCEYVSLCNVAWSLRNNFLIILIINTKTSWIVQTILELSTRTDSSAPPDKWNETQLFRQTGQATRLFALVSICTFGLCGLQSSDGWTATSAKDVFIDSGSLQQKCPSSMFVKVCLLLSSVHCVYPFFCRGLSARFFVSMSICLL